MKFNHWLFIIIILIISSGCEKEIFVESQSDGISKNSQTLDISSNPQGADVYINGRKTGFVTPCKIKWIEKADLAIKLKLSPYSDYEFSVPANQISSNPFFYDFFTDDRNFGMVVCNTDPAGAKIIMNGIQLTEKTPQTFTSLRPGSYTFRFQYPMHRDDSVTVMVPMKKNENDIVRINESLIDTTLFVDYTRELPFDAINHILCINSLTLSISTMSKGYYDYYYPDKFLKKMYNFRIPSQVVHFSVYDPYWILWISTNDGLLKVANNTKMYNMTNTLLKSNIITSLCFDKNNYMWLSTEKGIYKCSLGSEVFEPVPLPYTPSNGIYVSAVGCSTDGTVWAIVPNRGEVISFSSNTWTKYMLYDPMGTYFMHIYTDKRNNVYFVGVNSIALYSNGAFSNLPVNGLGKITNFFIDSDETMYISGNDAIKIVKKDGSSNTVSLKVRGLTYNPQIMSVAVDFRKNIWLGTANYGLMKLKYPIR